MAPAKQRPSVLVTDSRERPNPRRGLTRQDSAMPTGRNHMRFMTVDNVLQYNSQIPSGQPRIVPVTSQRVPSTSSKPAHVRRASGGGLANTQSRTGQLIPSRTTKISEKLVLLPETENKDEDDEESLEVEAILANRLQDPEGSPLRDEELDVLRKRGGIRGKSYAERLPKVQRTEKVSRVTAYCTAQAFKIKSLAEFLRKKHEAKTKLYDDCLYVIYALPMLNGTEGYRVRSRPILKTPGTGKTVLDIEIERSEQRDHHEGYFDDDAFTNPASPEQRQHHLGSAPHEAANSDESLHSSPSRNDDESLSHISRIAPEAKNFAEMFVYSYGVVVFWNFTEHQEKDILADLTFADAEDGISLLTRPLEQDSFETEEFHFEYSADIKRPRVFNDMITLLPRSDHMIKLTISHAIAQSTKLCFFEERMSETMLDAQHVPKRMALTGQLRMTRNEIVRILGRLFMSRVEINLSSNVLDVPNFFWDSEPTLHPLYAAIREYLEIDPRIKVLNERCRVFLDLAEILSDSVADSSMSWITWVIIVLICVSLAVTITEVVLRFAMLERSKPKDDAGHKAAGTGALANVRWHHAPVDEVTLATPLLHIPGVSSDFEQEQRSSSGPSDLEILAQALGLRSNASLDDVQQGIRKLRQAAACEADDNFVGATPLVR